MDIEYIINLFKKYGFDHRKSISTKDYLAFTYKSGFFHNAELVSLNIKEKDRIDLEMNSSLAELEKLGFSTKKSFYATAEDLEEKLFNGFFQVENWRKRVDSDYKNHTKRILKTLPSGPLNYEYITVPYLKNNIPQELNLVKNIINDLESEGPLLAIIEAPAGFGKTCTSFEIIKNLIDDENLPLPFFTEFSRDRQARVFSHIFVREVDKSFNSVKSDAVVAEVRNGRIVVVLDGFDELLHDNSVEIDSNSDFENAEPMLETISELLTKNAKVILTSRRSAIFDGEIFNDWLSRYEDKFKINRYRLDQPQTKDWITPEKYKALSDSNIDIDKLSNPVLLSYLRFLDQKTFDDLCGSPSLIVERYFSSMLEREMERQDLRMTPVMQSELLTLVAEDMCEKNYTSDSKEKIINLIKEKANHLLIEVRATYPPKDRPTLDKLATTLSNHAFFDKSSGDEDIEFINEFVFGNYISAAILRCQDDWMASDERFIEPAVLAYVPRAKEERKILWNGLGSMRAFLDASSRMKFEASLIESVECQEYDHSDIRSINLKKTKLFSSGKISGSVFYNSTFTETSFNLNNFEDITFINCSFWSCTYEADKSKTLSVDFYNCDDNNRFIVDIESLEKNSDLKVPEPEISEFILAKMWPLGSPSIERLHHFLGNLCKSDKYSKKEILRGIKILKNKNIISVANDVNFVVINKVKIPEIKQILGRE